MSLTAHSTGDPRVVASASHGVAKATSHTQPHGLAAAATAAAALLLLLHCISLPSLPEFDYKERWRMDRECDQDTRTVCENT